MTNKTALEMLIDILNREINMHPKDALDRVCNNTLRTTIMKAQDLLTTERTQIEEAFDEGIQTSRMAADFARHPELKNKCKYTCFKGASDYFNKTFKDGE